MEQYINKSALVAEIDVRRDKIMKGICIIPLEGRQRADATFEYEILGLVRDLIDTLEVKEVDLEKPFEGIKVQTSMGSGSLDEIIVTTRYKAQKGE